MPTPKSVDGLPPPADATLDPTHELKNLLGVLMGVCESLGEGHDPKSEQAELARVGLTAAERAAKLVTRIQDATRARESQTASVVGLTPAPEGQGGTVLVVDDDPDLLKLITTNIDFVANMSADWTVPTGNITTKLQLHRHPR